MRHLLKNFLASVLLLSMSSTPALAQADAEEANSWAEARGEEMYLHDQAAWHGTDALREEIDLADHPELRGYVVDSLENGNLALVFFAEDDEGLYEFARYEVDGSQVIAGGVLKSDDRVRLSAE